MLPMPISERIQGCGTSHSVPFRMRPIQLTPQRILNVRVRRSAQGIGGRIRNHLRAVTKASGCVGQEALASFVFRCQPEVSSGTK